MIGKQVAILVNGLKIKGNYSAEFDTKDFNNTSGGIYYKIEAGNFSDVKKMILLK